MANGESESYADATGQRPGARFLEYVFGRYALIGVASLMLLLISGYATWHGMRDFIVGVSTEAQPASGEGGAPLTISTEALVLVLVVALTFLMWLSLRETFGARRRVIQRLITLPLYVFLFLWSVGFGYGFWWSLISGSEATQTGLRGQAEDVRDAAVGVAARLEAVKARLDSVVALSERQMAREESSGGSCGKDSGAGRGPLYRARAGVRERVAALSQNMTSNWLGRVDAELAALNAQLAEASTTLDGATIAQRQAQFESAAAAIRGAARGIAVRSDALGASFASEMRTLAGEVAIAPDQPGFSCYDPALANLLTDAATESERPAEVTLREAAFAEGAAGVAQAVKGLWENVGAYSGALISYVVSGFDGERLARTEAGQPITGRDMIALLATIGIDLGLLALSALNPPPPPPLSGDTVTELRRAIRVTKNRTGRKMEWLKKHIFHHGRTTYWVVPDFEGCITPDRLEDYRTSTHEKDQQVYRDLVSDLLSNPDLIEQGLDEAKLADPKFVRDQYAREALYGQGVNLLTGVFVDAGLMQPIRRLSSRPETLRDEKSTSVWEDTAPDSKFAIWDKAQRALKFAGWSKQARRRPEVFELVDIEGLSPFLKAFNAAAVDEADDDDDDKSKTVAAPAAAG